MYKCACSQATSIWALAGPFSTLRMRAANLSVCSVSENDEGDKHATMSVFASPPIESAKKNVSFESRYGTCVLWLRSAAMTCPSCISDLLMFPASTSRSPFEPDSFSRSEPARSTCSRAVWQQLQAFRNVPESRAQLSQWKLTFGLKTPRAVHDTTPRERQGGRKRGRHGDSRQLRVVAGHTRCSLPKERRFVSLFSPST